MFDLFFAAWPFRTSCRKNGSFFCSLSFLCLPVKVNTKEYYFLFTPVTGVHKQERQGAEKKNYNNDL